MKLYRNHILVEIDETAKGKNDKEFVRLLKNKISEKGLDNEIKVMETGSLGYFSEGSSLVIYPEAVTYTNLVPEDIKEIVDEHLLKGRKIERLMPNLKPAQEVDFKYKNRIVLKNSGIINPEDIEEYIGVGGYEAWEKALTKMNSDSIIQEVKDSNLRGRGGAGFPTGLKWTFTAPLKDELKYFVINADEGEPGTFKDRLIMEGDPHKLLEGLMISSYAVGASIAYIYIRGEYKLCIDRLQKAIDQAKEYGLLGENILESGYNLDIKIKLGAGAYVCGEETALIESMEGNRGEPRNKPPFPGVKGYLQRPTVVNNVETISNIPAIINNGGEWFSKIGEPKSPGTKVFTILGDIKNPGLCEVEMGTTLRTIINEHGGGMKTGKTFKAASIGGAAGVLLSEDELDTKLDFHSLSDISAVLGSGAMLILDEDSSIFDLLFSTIRFFRHESCGQCLPCANGTQQAYVLIKKIKDGNGTKEDYDLLREVAEAMKATSFCALGQSLIMSLGSALDKFKNELFEKLN